MTAGSTEPTVVALESSCDETACAVVRGGTVASSVVASQVEVHATYGGVVPELASRHHLAAVVPVVRKALADAGLASVAEADAVAVTEGPGLVGALLVGVQVARALAAATDRPLYGIHHLEGHLFSAVLGDHERPSLAFEPHVALVVSGGHTELFDVAGLGRYLRLGATRDDAAGEAFDKVGKLLGLPYPGGPVVDRLALEGDPRRHAFPRGMIREGFEFSFSGLKTAVLVHLEREGQPRSRAELADVCASFQAAVVDVLVEKSLRALDHTGRRRLHVVGGVAANRGLRERVERAARERGLAVVVPPPRYCGDNAAMIAAAAAARIRAGVAPALQVYATAPLDDPRLRVP